ncbi:MAG: cytochrome c [Campylobacterales bacterium]|nr:cytochrome c [Campylobacterales bacterium]
MKYLFLFLPFFLVGCFPQSQERWYEKERISKGKTLYNQYCISCHNKNAAGTKDWKKTDKDGFLPPPPLNGTAHTWHHDADLLFKIMDEGGALYNGKMPPFKDVLTKEDKLNILAYIQNFWKNETYEIWIEEIQKGREVK